MRKRDGREAAIRKAGADHIRNNLNNPVPAYVAADGPKALKAAGADADGMSPMRYRATQALGRPHRHKTSR